MSIGYITDIEGDLDYWHRYIEASDVLFRDHEGRICLKDDTRFVFGGDAVDHSDGDLRVLADLIALKRKHPDRVVLLMGNRDINKLRLTVELCDTHREGTPLSSHPGPYWDRGAAPSKTLAPEQLAGNSEADRLRWILGKTMGAPLAFECRKSELAAMSKDGLNVSEENVVESFRSYASPGGLLFEYLQCAHLAAQIDDTLFLHAGLPRGSGGWSPGWLPEKDAPETSLSAWIASLDALARDALEECCAAAAKKNHPRGEAWALTGGYGHEQPGSKLLQYGMRDFPDGSAQPSVVYNGLLDEDYQPITPDEATLSWLQAGGVRRIVCGHLPHGDAPLVLRLPMDMVAITADCCYASEVAGAPDCPRGGAVCEVLLGTSGETRIHGFLAGGVSFSADLAIDTAIGRLTSDGWRVKGRTSEGRLVLCRNAKWQFETRLADEYEVEWASAAEPSREEKKERASNPKSKAAAEISAAVADGSLAAVLATVKEGRSA